MSFTRLLGLSGAVLCAAVAMAQTAPTSVFQLDGQTALNTSWPNCVYVDKTASPPANLPPTTCDYWNLLNGTGTVGVFTGGTSDHWLVRTFQTGGAGTANFAQGSKDIEDPQDSWRYSTGSTPDKNTLTNGYVAAYTDLAGDLLLIFGAERFSILGDANIGMWFFQEDVHPVAGSNRFTGHHRNKDVFIVSAFTGGGDTPTISVYLWDDTCTGAAPGYNSNDPPSSTNNVCANKNVRYLTSTAALCSDLQTGGTTISTALSCAVTNQNTINTPWPSSAKSGSGGLPPQTFFTGGINLSAVLRSVGVTDLPCFSSFLFNTRTSQSVTATLKDFIGGGFPLCSITVTKACPLCVIVNQGTAFQYTVQGTIRNTGIGTLYNAVVTDDAGTPGVASDDLTFACGTIGAGATKYWGDWSGALGPPPAGATACSAGGQGNTFISSQNPATNAARVTSSSSPSDGTPVTASTSTITCAICQVSPDILVSKVCNTDLQLNTSNQVVVRVDFTGTVQNTGTATLNNVSVSEDHDANGSIDVSTLSLQPLDSGGNPVGSPCTSCTLSPGQVARFSGSYLPSVLTALDVGGNDAATGNQNVTPQNTGRAQFNDTVAATGTSALRLPNCTTNCFPTASDTHTAHCVVCPLGACLTVPIQ